VHDQTITVDLEAFNEVRERASRRQQLSVRAVVLALLALVLATVSHRVIAVPLVGVSLLCAAIVVRHELGERKRRRALAGSMSRNWT